MRFITKISELDDPIIQAESDEKYGVEYFHIYTNESISERHLKSLDYLDELRQTWSFSFSAVVLIDNYSPSKSIISGEEIIAYLDSKAVRPDYFAYEADLISNASILLASITDTKITKSYTRYIQNHNQYPCSLLTAAWYLTRLGYLDSSRVIRSTLDSNKPFATSSKLVNILPDIYMPIEKLARQLILSSKFASAADNIEDLLYSF